MPGKSTLFLLLSALCSLAPAWAQTAPDILAYDIPADALKERVGTRRPDVVTYRYFLRKPDGKKGDLVGIEYFRDNTEVGGEEILIKRETYKFDPAKILIKNRLHGIKREWYINGQLKSEEPYRMNVRDGLFRHWDEQGNLVGQYQMNNGDGVLKIYNSKGQLIEEADYTNNHKEGLDFEFYPPLTYSFGWLKQDKYQGIGFEFFGKRLIEMGYWGDNGRAHGPVVRFDLRNEEEKKNPDLGNGVAYAGASN